MAERIGWVLWGQAVLAVSACACVHSWRLAACNECIAEVARPIAEVSIWRIWTSAPTLSRGRRPTAARRRSQ